MTIRTSLFVCQSLSAVSDSLLSRYRALLGASERDRLARLRGQRCRDFIVGRALLRMAATHWAGGQIQPLEWTVVERTDLPPCLVEAEALNMGFSISHSRDMLAIAIAGGPVAIDVEYRRNRNFVGLARQWFHSAEAEALSAMSPARRQVAFYRLWTLKEASIKLQEQSIFSGLMRQLRFRRVAPSRDVPRPIEGERLCRLLAGRYNNYSLALAAWQPIRLTQAVGVLRSNDVATDSLDIAELRLRSYGVVTQ